jgi:hypothetical protein
MTIARKGSRPLVVDGVAYRWSVRSRPTYDQALGDSPLTIAVVNDESPGSTLVVSMDGPRPDNWMRAPGVQVTPATIERAIRKALSHGWRSAQNGSPVLIALTAEA